VLQEAGLSDEADPENDLGGSSETHRPGHITTSPKV